MNNKLQFQLEEFNDMRHNAFIKALELKNKGKNIAGIYGVNVPKEILWAMDIVPINIFGIDGSNIKSAEEVMDNNLCSLIKASYGYVITDRCPFSHFADVVIGTNYCPHKESMIHRLEGLKQVYIIKENKNANELASEYKKFAEFLQQKFNVILDEDKLLDIVNKTNAVSKIINEIKDIYFHYTGVISAMDLINIVYGSQFVFDLDERFNKLHNLKKSLEDVIVESRNINISKILITGAPMVPLKDELLEEQQSIKNSILTVSYCEGENHRIIGDGDDIYYAIAKKYLTVNIKEDMSRIISKYNISALVNANMRGCGFMKEDYSEFLEIPCLNITIDYNDNEKENIAKLWEFMRQHYV